METGLLFRWGRPIEGREDQAVALFGEVMTYFEELKTAGKFTYFEPFLFSTSDKELDQGFMIAKGPVTEIFKLVEEERYVFLMQKSMMLLEHFQTDFLIVGETITDRLASFEKVRAELGI